MADELLSKCVSLLELLLDREGSGVTNHSLIINGHGGPEKWMLNNRACIYDLMAPYKRPPHAPLVCVMSHAVTREKPAMVARRTKWINWMMYESPWRFAYIYKEEFNASKNYSSAIRCDVDQNYFATACNVLRHGAENDNRLSRWEALVDAGITPALALVLSVYDVSVEAGVVAFDNYYRDDYIHSLFSNTSSKEMINILSGNRSYNDMYRKDHYSDSKRYAGATDLLANSESKIMDEVRKLDRSKANIPAELDLLERVITPSKEVNGYSVEVLNNYWRGLCAYYT